MWDRHSVSYIATIVVLTCIRRGQHVHVGTPSKRQLRYVADKAYVSMCHNWLEAVT